MVPYKAFLALCLGEDVDGEGALGNELMLYSFLTHLE